ncbi:hypothetical protein EW146_g1105 [Bondarzewia mesenterica]|uniref:Pre-mRNA-processing protein 45 n=1 Tax=Bondarzewia mesenterica TaxID=1095465 RepID=A0A4S4M767_9AGAM|nr:hypothetical protein EW146_g1105 [Bondarzewia mesenterica]
MGQGGRIILVNGTPYQWQRTYQYSYQMNAWNFPSTIEPGQTVPIYVEWDEGFLTNVSDDGGEASYALAETNCSFQVQARANNGFQLKVYFEELATLNNPLHTVLKLGWDHDGAVSFVLSGTAGHFTSNNPPPAWMQSNISTLGNRPLRRICLPGSHDAGMSIISGGTIGAFPCNCLTQNASVAGQLSMGSRYFDIRPVISAGHYYTGHYSQVGDNWLGANGQSIQDVINDINDFTANNAELIIMTLSHDYNTDVGNISYRHFTQDEWNGLFSLLLSINGLFVAPGDPTSVDLRNLTLNQFIGNGRAAVVIIFQPGQQGPSLGSFAYSGFYDNWQLSVFNRYSNTNDKDAMANDQVQKMRDNGDGYFLLSWTLTQNDVQASTCWLGTARSIYDLAYLANSLLYFKVLPKCNGRVNPNILLVDNMGSNPAIVALAMAINYAIVIFLSHFCFSFGQYGLHMLSLLQERLSSSAVDIQGLDLTVEATLAGGKASTTEVVQLTAHSVGGSDKSDTQVDVHDGTAIAETVVAVEKHAEGGPDAVGPVTVLARAGTAEFQISSESSRLPISAYILSLLNPPDVHPLHEAGDALVSPPVYLPSNAAGFQRTWDDLESVNAGLTGLRLTMFTISSSASSNVEAIERERLEALAAAPEKVADLKDELDKMTQMYETCSQDIGAHRAQQEELACHVRDLVEESLLSQRDTDLAAFQSALQSESKKLGESHTAARFSLQLEVDRLKHDLERVDKKGGQAETKPFTNFSVFHDNLITRLKSLSQIQLDFDKRVKEIEKRFAEKLTDVKKQLTVALSRQDDRGWYGVVAAKRDPETLSHTFFAKLPPKLPETTGTVWLFARSTGEKDKDKDGDDGTFYTVHGPDAFVNLSASVAKTFLRDALMAKPLKVEIWVPEPGYGRKAKKFVLDKESNLPQEICRRWRIFFLDDDTLSALMVIALKVASTPSTPGSSSKSKNKTVGIAFADASLRSWVCRILWITTYSSTPRCACTCLQKALFVADRHSREEVRQRALMQHKLAQKEKASKEENLRLLAQRAGIAPSRPTAEGQAAMKLSLAVYGSASEASEDEEDEEAGKVRDEMRAEKQREREREMRMSNMDCASSCQADDVEGVDVGLAVFNQVSLSASFADDQSYGLYDRPLFHGSTAAAVIYKARGNISEGNEESFSGGDRRRHWEGAGPIRVREGPAQFEKDTSDVFSVDKFLDEAKSGRKRGLDTEA